MKEIKLKMNEQKKYEVIKRLAECKTNKYPPVELVVCTSPIRAYYLQPLKRYRISPPIV